MTYLSLVKSFVFLFFCLFVINIEADTSSDETVIKVAGWDVYADPNNRNKTIGYKSFEKLTGYQIDFTPLSNLDDIIHYAENTHHVDVLIVSNEGIEILYKMNLVKDLDLSNISNYDDLHPSLKYTHWSQFQSNTYAVPWAWGPTGLLFDTEQVNEPDSWNILWDPKYSGQVALWDDISMIWTTALSLGYTNVYNLTQDQLYQVKEKLLALNKQVYGYYKGEQEEFDYLTSGKVLITNSWFDPSSRLAQKNKKFKMIIPKEGAVGMFDSYLISKNSHNLDASYQYINHQISPEIQYKLSQITGLAPSNIETLSLMTQDEIKALHLDDQNYFRKMILWDVMPRKHLYEKILLEVEQDFNNKKTIE